MNKSYEHASLFKIRLLFKTYPSRKFTTKQISEELNREGNV